MWSYQVPLDEAEPLEKHIVALQDKFKNKKKYLLDLKRKLNVDVLLGYRSNCDHAGVQVSHTALKMFTELQIPFGISIIIAQKGCIYGDGYFLRVNGQKRKTGPRRPSMAAAEAAPTSYNEAVE